MLLNCLPKSQHQTGLTFLLYIPFVIALFGQNFRNFRSDLCSKTECLENLSAELFLDSLRSSEPDARTRSNSPEESFSITISRTHFIGISASLSKPLVFFRVSSLKSALALYRLETGPPTI